MASQALYRKWRSQTFTQLVGQDHVLRTIRNALVEERIAHAYLFTGPRGVGKTSMARLLAKAVNCSAPPTERPCGTCKPCTAIAEGHMVDVIEMDAASHTSVDDARDLIERVQFRPTSGRYKVYVIDEVHMLSTAAFNALLKTLEEPPDHAIFILATTEVHKVPATILSRCQRFTFTRHTNTAIAAHLHHIAAEEHWNLEPGVAEAIARSATGSMRDALGVLEQLSSFAGETVTLEQVQSLLGMSSATEIQDLVQALLSGDLGGALRIINAVADQGADMRQFTRDLIEQLRTLMLLMATGDKSTLLDVGEDDLARFQEWAQSASIGQVMHWIKLLSNLDYQLRTSPYGHLPLELATVEALTVPRASEPAAPPAARPIAQKPTNQEPRPPERKPPPPAPKPATVNRETPDPPAEPEPGPPPTTPSAPSVGEPPEPPPEHNSPTPMEARAGATSEAEPPDRLPLTNPAEHEEPPDQPDSEATPLEQLKANWNKILRDVRPLNAALQAMLRGVQPMEVEGDTVLLLATSKFHQDNIEKPRNRQIVEQVISKHMQATFQIECTVKPTEKKKDHIRNKTQAAQQDSLVNAAMNIFGADVVDIEEDKDHEG